MVGGSSAASGSVPNVPNRSLDRVGVAARLAQVARRQAPRRWRRCRRRCGHTPRRPTVCGHGAACWWNQASVPSKRLRTTSDDRRFGLGRPRCHGVRRCGCAVRDMAATTCAECLELARNDTPSAEVASSVAMERRGWEDADCPLCKDRAGRGGQEGVSLFPTTRQERLRVFFGVSD